MAAITLFAAHLAWAAKVSFGQSPIAPTGQTLVSADLLIIGAVVTVGILLDRTPWTRKLALLSIGAQAAIAVTHPVDILWLFAATFSAIAAFALAPAPSGRWFASPARQQVPARATALALGLLLTPSLIGAASRPEPTIAGLVLAGVALIGAWAYTRALVSVLWMARIVWPLGIIGAAIGLSWPSAAVLIGVGASVTWLAWTSDARVAAGPLMETRKAIPLLPEMVPAEILDSAGFDSKGRPKDHE